MSNRNRKVLKNKVDTDKQFQQENIKQLIQILYSQNQETEAAQMSELLLQMQEMSKNYYAVFQELQDVKAELNQLRNTPKIEAKESKVVNYLVSYEEKIQDRYEQMQTMCEKVNEKAGGIIQKFKDIGIKALNNVCSFLGIKETLIKMRDAERSNAEDTRRCINKIDSIGNEIKNAAVHIKNIGRAIAGKDVVDPASKEQAQIFQKLKAHYEKNLETHVKRADKLDAAIEKVAKLEQAADKVSLKQKLEKNKADIAAKEATEPKQEKEKPLQADLSL